jgi:hypothetical protein
MCTLELAMHSRTAKEHIPPGNLGGGPSFLLFALVTLIIILHCFHRGAMGRRGVCAGGAELVNCPDILATI